MVFTVVQVFRNVRHGSSILCLFCAFVKRRLNDLCAYKLSAYIDLYLLAHTCELSRYIRKSDILLEKRRRTSRRHSSHSLPVDDNILMIASNAALNDFKPRQLALHAVGLLT